MADFTALLSFHVLTMTCARKVLDPTLLFYIIAIKCISEEAGTLYCIYFLSIQRVSAQTITITDHN
jgi:hypothetical protein